MKWFGVRECELNGKRTFRMNRRNIMWNKTLSRRQLVKMSAAAGLAAVSGKALADVPPGYVAGDWYPPNSAVEIAGSALVAGDLYFRPVFIAQALTVHALGARVSTAFAGGNFQLALYRNNSGISPSPNRPGLLVDHTRSISTATVGAFSGLLGANRSISAGWYWTGHQCDNTTARFISNSNWDPL
jgi:hypothetical protein